MKIIRKGTKKEDKRCQFTCTECRSVIEAKKSEGRYIDSIIDMASIEFICPLCECKNWVDVSKFE